MPTKRRAYFVWLCILFWLEFKYIWMPILCSIFTRNMKWNSRLAINVARKKNIRNQRKNAYKFYTRVNLISLMRCHSLVASPTFICIDAGSITFCIIIIIIIKLEWEQVSCYHDFFLVLFFICLLTLSDDWLIDWLPCTTKRNGCNTRYIYCVTDGNWCVTLQIKR